MRAFELTKNKWELLISNSDKNEAGPELVDLVKHAYSVTPKGSMIQSLKDVIPSDWNVIDWDQDPDIDACVFYRKNRQGESWVGYKIQGLGHDGTRQSKDKAIHKMLELLKKPGVWIESSDALRHVLHKMNAPSVKDERFLQRLFNDQSLYMVQDDTYSRTLQNGQDIQETVFGQPKLVQQMNESTTPKVLYHVTPARNIKSIQQQGLVPSIGQRSAQLETESNLYFFPSKEAAEDAVMNWLGDELPEDEQLALLAVNSKGLEGKFTPGAEYEFTVSSPVPPQNIKVISTNF